MTVSEFRSPFATARRLGIRRGLIGGNRTWLVLGGLAWSLHFVRRAIARQEEVVTIEKLKPGEAIQIRAIPRR